MKVLLTTNCPTPYINGFADELGKLCDLTLVYEMKLAKNRHSSWLTNKDGWNFQLLFLDGIPFNEEQALSFKIKKIIKNGNFNKIIIANPTTPTGIVALLYCRRHKIPFIIQSEGGFQGSGKGLKEKFKKYIMEKADMYLTGMGGDDDYFLMYGATKDKLKPYYFTSSYKKDIDERILTQSEKGNLKKELGIKQQKMILYVGQFIHRKGIDILLKSYKGLGDDTCLYLIGGEPTQEYLDIIKENNLKNVNFVKFMSKDELRKYYQASDLFVMTTREDTWGLVINEAMEHGLPVITTKRCIAGNYLINNKENGFLVDVEDYETTHEKIKLILNDDSLRQRMSLNNLNKIKDHTLENMAQTIYNYIKG